MSKKSKSDRKAIYTRDLNLNDEENLAIMRAALVPFKQEPINFSGKTLPEVLPPWKAVPEYPQNSMGWRMGSGEDYWHAWHNWFGQLGASVREEYKSIFPEPESWSGFYLKTLNSGKLRATTRNFK